ncbi:hypothetical protein ASG43_16795 [Aureimonas sp. Leaf454]|uniref:hypothetical protein n=1 Tax=Aureimonas sp. Leaf454 TaxID=1736381 RepID=UPI0006FA5ADD|nr:hypothetical protein [Aureimonas sp. Leaf454]KQT43160.1 hypothetical protein ASG43_16795 [Aureimonas sp. Leaf454]
MSGPSADRCPLCAARALAPTDRHLDYPSGGSRSFALACSFCGLLLAEGAEPEAVRLALSAVLEGRSFTSGETAPFGLDIYTLRIAATSRRRGVEPADAVQAQALRQPHSNLAAAADLFDLRPAEPLVSLGILCRRDELARVLSSLPAHAAWTDDVAILLDDTPLVPDALTVAGFPDRAVRLAARPLGGDFAGQRNALQALSRQGWMLQLDADETLAPQTGALLGALVRQAERQGLRSIGLPRRNLVDGVLSDLHPDTQYRLNHRGIRYVGCVHERPDRPWQDSSIALHGAIDHHLGRAHVDARSHRYEAMAPGGGRLEEARLLLTPYRR